MSGKRPVVPEGFESSQTALAVRDEGQRPSGMGTGQRLFSGVVWCLGGSVLLSMMPVLACTLIAFGAAQVIGTGSLRGQVLVLVAAIAAACADAFLLGGVYDIPMSVCSIVCAFAMAALLMTGRLSTGKVLVAVAAIQAAMIGIDTVSTSLQGTSITALITDVVDRGDGTYLIYSVEGNLSSRIKRFCYLYDANAPANRNMADAPQDAQTDPATYQYTPQQNTWYVKEFCMTWY